jgi:cytochrome c-type biogenesis protein CcmH
MTHQKRGWFPAAALVLLGGWSVGACSKKDDEGKPAAVPAMAGNPTPPPSAPAPAAAPIAAEAPPHAPMGMAPAAAEPPPAAGSDAPPDPKASISGTVILPAARRGDVSPSDVIYLVARRIADNPQARGTLVAVKRLSAASFPIKFTLSAQDMMIPTGAFEGDLSISVRVDKDGDPMTRRKGDVFGGLPRVKVGAQGVKLSLDQLQKEDESLAAPGPINAPGPMGALPPGHP